MWSSLQFIRPKTKQNNKKTKNQSKVVHITATQSLASFSSPVFPVCRLESTTTLLTCGLSESPKKGLYVLATASDFFSPRTFHFLNQLLCKSSMCTGLVSTHPGGPVWDFWVLPAGAPSSFRLGCSLQCVFITVNQHASLTFWEQGHLLPSASYFFLLCSWLYNMKSEPRQQAALLR